VCSSDLSAKEIQVKIVYYGPGRGGKTTNLEFIFKKFRERIQSEMVSIKTHGDRTLYFDFFPFDIGQIKGYDISSTAKYAEMEVLLSNFIRSLNNDDLLKFQNEMENRGNTYFKQHIRELERTGIARISLNTLEVGAAGNVPGRPLNQFSLDEYNKYLRIAVTVGQNNMFGTESANDLYVLNSALAITGSVKDMGITERIYSARFIADRGYIVTFRQTDPFYVIDLSDPAKPELKGELKIPGYSGYLHPISEHKILGIGKEGNNIKISLFDVTSAANPKEAAKYTLNEYYSDILNNHHAFLLDSKHQVFFLPGQQGGYVFSYAGEKLELKKAVSGIQAKRALYLDDYMYILGDKIVVLNENTWEKVKELEITN